MEQTLSDKMYANPNGSSGSEINFDRLLSNYRDAIQAAEKSRSTLSKNTALELLLARDHLEVALNTKQNIEENDLSEIFQVDQQVSILDEQLKNMAQPIADTISLDKWKRRLQASDEQWWWSFNASKKVNAWDRVDWLWDALTLGALAIAASFMVSIISAISVGSLTVASTLSTIAQVGGLAIVSQGALTKAGQQKVQNILAKFTIPTRFHSEAMLIMSLALLTTVYITHQSLNGRYLEDGRTAYDQGALGEAELTFLRGLEIEPDNSTFNAELGRIYESLGVLDKAISQYYLNVQAGGVKGINDLGRTYINWVNPVTRKNDPTLSEAYLLLALQRAESIASPDQDLRYQVHRNLGWVLLKQEKYSDAERYLKKAISLDKTISENQIGGGMAYCFLAQVYEEQNKMDLANSQWSNCINKARPETIHEYKWFTEVKKDGLATCINTGKIVSGLNESSFEKNILGQSHCQTILARLNEENMENKAFASD